MGRRVALGRAGMYNERHPPFQSETIMRRLLLLFVVLLLLTVCFGTVASKGIFWNVEPETISRQTLVRVIQLRDFSHFSPEFVERLTDRAEQEFGRLSPNRPVFELPQWEKQIHIYFQTNKPATPSNLENNLNLMARIRYFQWMHEYESGELHQRAALMQSVVEDMRYWRDIYFEYLRFLGQPEPTLAELQEEFLKMIESFKIGASANEVALIDSFTQEMTRAMFAAEVQKTLIDWLPMPW